MKFYVDFDDCLCETARAFTEIAARLFGKHVPYEKVRFFNLQESFQLTEEQYGQLMAEGHLPEVLLSYEETQGAVQALNAWMDQGHEVFVITGRPYSAYKPSRRWLNEHGLERAALYCLNKYGRESSMPKGDYNLELEDYYRMQFDYAIEDSPKAFPFFAHLPKLQVMVFDRPWNQDCELPGSNFKRCTDWEEIRRNVKEPSSEAREGRG